MRLMRNLVVLVAFALVAAACGEEGSLVVNTTTTTTTTTTITTTTTTTVPTTTTTEPPTTTTTLGDFALAVDMTFAYRVEADGTCVTTSYEGVNYDGLLTEGAEVVIEDLATGEIVGSYPLGEGTEQPSRYGPNVCRFETTASLPVDGSYRYYLADAAGVDGTYMSENSGDFGGHLFYPLGVEVGQGIYLVPPEVYATAVPIWHSDMSRALRGLNPRADDLLNGVGLKLPTGTVLSNPVEGGFWAVLPASGSDTWNDIYVNAEKPQLGTKQIYVVPTPFDDATGAEENDPGIRVISAEGNLSGGPAYLDDVDTPIGFEQTIGTVTSAHHELPVLVDEVEILVIIWSFDEAQGRLASSTEAVLRFFPYLEVEQPVSDWSHGITVVMSDDCDVCDEILAELVTAPDSLEVHVVDLEDRVVRYFGIREAPTVTIRGPGEFDLVTRTGLDAVDQLQELVDKACTWFDC